MAERTVRPPPAGIQTSIPPFVHRSGYMPPPGQKEDEIDEMSKAMVRDLAKATRMKLIKDTVSPSQQMVSQPAERVDYSSFFKAMGDINQGLANQLTTMYQSNANLQNNPALQAVQKQVDKIADRMENAGKGGQVSEMEIFFNGMQRFEAMGSILRKSLGIPDEIKSSGGDLPHLLAMEELRARGAREAREHDEKMIMLKRQMDLEDRRGDQNYKLEVIKFADERKRKDNTGKMFEDLLGSVMESIDLSPDEKQVLGFAAQPPPAQEAPRPRIKKFTCQACGNPVDVPSPDIAQIACPKCQTEYDLGIEGPSSPMMPEKEPA